MTDKKKKKNNDFSKRRRQNCFTLLFFGWLIVSARILGFLMPSHGCKYGLTNFEGTINYEQLLAHQALVVQIEDMSFELHIIFWIVIFIFGSLLAVLSNRQWLSYMMVTFMVFACALAAQTPMGCDYAKIIHIETVEDNGHTYHLAYGFTKELGSTREEVLVYTCEYGEALCDGLAIAEQDADMFSINQLTGTESVLEWTIDNLQLLISEPCDYLIVIAGDELLQVVAEGNSVSSEQREALGCPVP